MMSKSLIANGKSRIANRHATCDKRQAICDTRMANLVVVFGPRTTLAKHILSTSWAGQKNLLLVARDKQEANWIGSNFPAAEILACWLPEHEWKWPEAYGCITVLLCAFAVIHPVMPDWSSHCEATRRDIEILSHILAKFRRQVIKIVFISSVLALALPAYAGTSLPLRRDPALREPKQGPERIYYVGFKCLAESMIRDLLTNQEGVSLSVFYPGRLVSQKSLLSPLSFLHTTYRRFAQRLVHVANSCTPHREIVGLDARILLVLKAFGLLMRAVF